MKNVDLYSDPGHGHLYHLFSRYPLVADFVKSAEFEDHKNQIPSTAFADKVACAYPVHSPEHAAISRIYAQEFNAPTPVLETIKEACDIYDLSNALFEPVEEKIASIAEEDCLFPDTQTYPIRTAEEVKTASLRLLDQAALLSLDEKKSLFSKLAEKAEEFNVELPARVYQYAQKTATDRKELARTIRARAAATKTAELRIAFNKIAEAVIRDKKGIKTAEVRDELVTKLAELDEKAGFTRLYTKSIPNPLLTVYNTTKVASAHGAVDLGSCSADKVALASLGSKFFSDLLGSDILPEITSGGRVDPEKMAAVVETLPMDLKSILASSAKSAGVAC